MSRLVRIALVLGVFGTSALAGPRPANAWWRAGWGFGFAPYVPFAPIVPAPYPYYYAPPPVYYAPPPVYAPPPAPAGQSCYAGPYVCPLVQFSPQGAPCSCPANDGGRVGGRVG